MESAQAARTGIGITLLLAGVAVAVQPAGWAWSIAIGVPVALIGVALIWPAILQGRRLAFLIAAALLALSAPLWWPSGEEKPDAAVTTKGHHSPVQQSETRGDQSPIIQGDHNKIEYGSSLTSGEIRSIIRDELSSQYVPEKWNEEFSEGWGLALVSGGRNFFDSEETVVYFDWSTFELIGMDSDSVSFIPPQIYIYSQTGTDSLTGRGRIDIGTAPYASPQQAAITIPKDPYENGDWSLVGVGPYRVQLRAIRRHGPLSGEGSIGLLFGAKRVEDVKP